MATTRETLTASLAAMGDRERLFAPPPGCTGHLSVLRVMGGFRVRIGGNLTGEARIYPVANEAAVAVELHRHTPAGRKVT